MKRTRLKRKTIDAAGEHERILRFGQHTGGFDPGTHVAVPEMKLSIVDVKCTDAEGRRYVVEMQVRNVEGFEKRVVYSASKAYVMQRRQAPHYPTLCDVVAVTICDFLLWPDARSPEVPMLSRWRMQEQHNGARGLSRQDGRAGRPRDAHSGPPRGEGRRNGRGEG